MSKINKYLLNYTKLREMFKNSFIIILISLSLKLHFWIHVIYLLDIYVVKLHTFFADKTIFPKDVYLTIITFYLRSVVNYYSFY